MTICSPDNDASKVSSPKPSSVADEEAATPPTEESMPKKSGRKRRGEGKDGKEGKEVKLKKKRAHQTASIVERPSRERKSVERYAALSPRKISGTKALTILQGPGEKLKDIPNVVFRLSKRKADESLRVLHTILFGRKTNVHFLKRNILQFSGFVWSQNEYKDRSKVREKLNKCNKDRLLEFCDLLDVYSLKVTTKKEEISAKLMEFLESPHVTREIMLSEKDKKGKKRKRRAEGTGEKAPGEASSDKGKKRLKRDLKGEAKKGHSITVEADQYPGKGVSIDTDDESLDEGKNGNAVCEDKNGDLEETSDHSDKSEAGDEENEHAEPQSANTLLDGEEMIDHEEPKFKVKSPVVKKVSSAQSRKDLASSRKKTDIDDDANVSSKNEAVFSMENKGNSKKKKVKAAAQKHSNDNAEGKASQKNGEAGSGPGSFKISEKDDKKKGKKKIETASEDIKGSKKQIAKMVSKDAGKKQGKHKDVSAEPSKGQLYAVVGEILKEVDFNVATLADIIRQLGAHFNTDLMRRKAEIKGILEEVINNMSDDEGANDEGDEAGA